MNHHIVVSEEQFDDLTTNIKNLIATANAAYFELLSCRLSGDPGSAVMGSVTELDELYNEARDIRYLIAELGYDD